MRQDFERWVRYCKNNRIFTRWNDLFVAACSGDAHEVERLYKRGEIAEEGDGWGYTPLLLAACFGHLGVVKVLCSIAGHHNSYVSGSNRRGESALHVAACCGHLEVAKVLLEHGADVNRRDIWNNTPLHEAAAAGRNAFMEAVHGGNFATVLLLAGGDATFDAYLHSESGLTLLNLAARYGHEELVLKLLELGLRIRREMNAGVCPCIMLCVKSQWLSFLNFSSWEWIATWLMIWAVLRCISLSAIRITEWRKC